MNNQSQSRNLNLLISGLAVHRFNCVFSTPCVVFSFLIVVNNITFNITSLATFSIFIFILVFWGFFVQHVGSWFPSQRLNPCLLHWEHGASEPLDHQGSPFSYF